MNLSQAYATKAARTFLKVVARLQEEGNDASAAYMIGCAAGYRYRAAEFALETKSVNVIFGNEGGIILDIGFRTDDPGRILQDLRLELARMNQGEEPYVPEDRYAEVTIRAKPGFLSLLRLMRWDVVFNFQEVTGMPWPRRFLYSWKKNPPRKLSFWSGPLDENYSTMSARDVADEIMSSIWDRPLAPEAELQNLTQEVSRILGRK